MMLFGILLILIFVGIDQLTKQLAANLLQNLLADLPVIPYLFSLNYHENTGASLGMLQGQMVFFMIITFIALVIFGYLFVSVDFKTKKTYSFAMVFFIAGTLGNAIDRALFGYVIDFMHFPFLDFILNPLNVSNFYNNLADMYLSAAIVLFFIDLFILDPKRKKREIHA